MVPTFSASSPPMIPQGRPSPCKWRSWTSISTTRNRRRRSIRSMALAEGLVLDRVQRLWGLMSECSVFAEIVGGKWAHELDRNPEVEVTHNLGRRRADDDARAERRLEIDF